MIDEELEAELLENAGVLNVVLRRNEMRQLMLASPIPAPIDATYDLRGATALTLIRDAMLQLADPESRVIRVIGDPVRSGGLLIEVTLTTDDLRAAMLDYGLRILILSAVISIVTASLLFLAVRTVLVTPIRRVVQAMQSYARAPEDARRIIEPQAGITELREAETALRMLQTDLSAALRQKDRLAQLGGAVAKISHDLRNILTTAQLFADRMEASTDPVVQRVAPKLVTNISRAVSLCEGTLAFGKAEEPAPRLERVALAPIVADVLENERLTVEDGRLRLRESIPAGMVVRADPEQLYRVLSNLVRNARQAIAGAGPDGEIAVAAEETDEGWRITVRDTGPGLPPKAREHLFRPFQGGIRKGGTGLGLAISQDLIRGHGGQLSLVSTGAQGTTFAITLPKALIALDDAAE